MARILKGRIKRKSNRGHPLRATEYAYNYITRKAMDNKYDRNDALDDICKRDEEQSK